VPVINKLRPADESHERQIEVEPLQVLQGDWHGVHTPPIATKPAGHFEIH